LEDKMGFFDYAKNIFGSFYTYLYYFLYSVPILILVFFFIKKIREKKIYKYPVRIFKVREAGKVKEINTRGGYIGRKNSAPFFRIITGKTFFRLFNKYSDLTTTPNPKFMDEEDRVYYKQIDVDSYVQLQRRFEGDDTLFTPVESDVKYGAILSVQRIKEVLRAEPTWKKILPYAGLILMAIVFIVSYAMLMDKCS